MKNGNYRVQETKCTLQQVLDEAKKKNGHILNCLNFPLSLEGVRATPLSTCVEAFLATKGQPWCPDEQGYPVPHFSWGLLSCKGARHVQHLDAAGANTSFRPRKGAKLLILARDPVSQNEPGYLEFSSLNAFTGQFAVNEPCTPVWNYEAVLLRPGDQL